jgi:hypothetical protein
MGLFVCWLMLVGNGIVRTASTCLCVLTACACRQRQQHRSSERRVECGHKHGAHAAGGVSCCRAPRVVGLGCRVFGASGGAGNVDWSVQVQVHRGHTSEGVSVRAPRVVGLGYRVFGGSIGACDVDCSVQVQVHRGHTSEGVSVRAQ